MRLRRGGCLRCLARHECSWRRASAQRLQVGGVLLPGAVRGLGQAQCGRMGEFSKRMHRDNAGKRARFEAVMDAVDAELQRGGGPYFLGAELSLVECVFAPMLERIAASIPYYKGLRVRGTGCAASIVPGSC